MIQKGSNVAWRDDDGGTHVGVVVSVGPAGDWLHVEEHGTEDSLSLAARNVWEASQGDVVATINRLLAG